MEQDFQITVEASHDALFSTWPKFADAIIKYADRVHPKYKESLLVKEEDEQNLTQSMLINLYQVIQICEYICQF